MYRSVNDAITAYKEKYTLLRAIQRAQQQRNTASNESGFNFWNEVVEALLKLKPKKQFKPKTKDQ